MRKTHVQVLERVLATMPVALGVAIAVFVLMRLMPGDPVDIMIGESGGVTQEDIASLRAELGLDKPVLVQLGTYLAGLVRGDLGYSMQSSRPVADMIVEALPATIELAMYSLVFALIVAVPAGVVSALRQGSAIDRASMTASLLGVSMPGFWFALIGIIVFSLRLGWLPTSGRITYGFEPETITGLFTLDALLTGNFPALRDALRHLVLPAATLGAGVAGVVARVVRSSMLEVLRADYVLFARAKGVAEGAVIVRHALRNALIPAVTVFGIQVGTLLGGNMIVETVFSWPGLGRVVVDAIFSRDYPLVQAAVMVYALTFVAVNLATDVLYTYLNPRMTL
ncbi:MAG: ABC transporter permease [Firmicutes bacterium]|nr:ABC transporter permease [Bacillota bacterium]MDH7494423.1 ABC transporter permease [Bacillota bacterium]